MAKKIIQDDIKKQNISVEEDEIIEPKKDVNVRIRSSEILKQKTELVRKEGNRNDRGIRSAERRAKENTDDKKAYRNDFDKKTYRSISLKYNNEKEKEIIDWLDSREELKPYLVGLLEKEIARVEPSQEYIESVEEAEDAKAEVLKKRANKVTDAIDNIFLKDEKYQEFTARDFKNWLTDYCNEIGKPMLADSTISVRLRKLHDAGKIEMHGQGSKVYYTVKK